MKEQYVAILKKEIFDYSISPFNPSEAYPELDLLPYKVEVDPKNLVYSMVRKILSICKLDETNYGTEKWNPFSEIVAEGNTVIIKPNLVRHRHPFGEKAVLSTVTNASLLRPIVDYTLLALNGRGHIIICDAPLQSANFNKVCEISGLQKLIAFYASKERNIKLSLLDLRNQVLVHNKSTNKNQVVQLKGDPLGYSIIDLGNDSLHSEIQHNWKKYFVTGYSLKNLRNYHNDKQHCYLISNSLLAADVIISVPKLKTHTKAGITVALKNFVGINGSKDFLPHHRIGGPQHGGDEYPTFNVAVSSVRSTMERIVNGVPVFGSALLFKYNQMLRTKVKEGNWYGNDTLWRTIADLNIIVKFSSKTGELSTNPQRRFFFIVDGIIGQERNGPMSGHPKKCGILLAGMNPCAVDYVAAKIMGFNYKYLRQIIVPFEYRSKTRYPIVNFDQHEIKISSNENSYLEIHKLERANSLKFSAPNGWELMEGT